MRFLAYPLCIFLVFINIFSSECQVITYGTANFSVELAKQNNFVMFYVPWCSASKQYSRTWNKLAKQFNTNESNVIIAKVDCDEDEDICSDITFVPTLKFYKLGDSKGVFVEKTNLEKLTRYINKQLEVVKLAESNTNQ